jgi:hypothetical protein
MESNEKLYFLRGSSQDSCGFLYDGEVIVEGVTCPVNVDLLAIHVKNVLSSTEKSRLVDNEEPLKIHISSSSFKENDRIVITITTLSGKKLIATVEGFLLWRHQGMEIVLIHIGNIRTNIIHK